jgi:O-acetyl-ADP-ribose deacetylase (regulator of RNase III)
VGPVWGEQSDAQSQKLLASAIDASMQILLQRKLHSITFPALSTGIFGFPKQLAASVFKKTLTQFLENAPDPLLVQICLYSAADYEIFQREFKK